jgi:hypothetical protein
VVRQAACTDAARTGAGTTILNSTALTTTIAPRHNHFHFCPAQHIFDVSYFSFFLIVKNLMPNPLNYIQAHPTLH